MRNRFFAQYAGIAPTILTFDLSPVYPTERQLLIERGELIAGMRLLNIYEYYREEDVVIGAPLADSLPQLSDLRSTDVAHPDGTIYYTGYQKSEAELDVIRDYRRRDGSVYLRAPGPEKSTIRSPWMLIDRDNRPISSWSRRVQWSHHWFRTLLGDRDRGFLISDGRFAAEKVLPFEDERFHLIHVMHNVHMHGRRQWNTPIAPTYQFVLKSISELDGLVSLTRRQREDIQQRMGPTNNLFTVSNPVSPPDRPESLPARERARFTMVTRFHPQKRLDHAIRMFALVVAERPDAQLRIYGDGETASDAKRLIRELGLESSVAMCGWDPDARDTLWTSTGFILTSAHEGYPLATLESMSRGCPVISYDIKYGPREQIAHGVDGFLVPDGDLRAMADTIVRMVDDPELVRSLGAAALVSAKEHDYRGFMQDWQHVLNSVVANKPGRVRLSRVECEVKQLGHVSKVFPVWMTRRAVPPRTGSAAFRRTRRVVFEASLLVSASLPKGALKDALLTLDAVSETSEVVSGLRLRVRRDKRRFHLYSTFDLGEVFAGRPEDDRSVTLRLRMLLRNASWETVVGRPAALRPALEISFDTGDELHVLRDVRRATDGS